MSEKKQVERIDLTKAQKLIGLKTMAYKEYIAARILFNNNHLHQATFFANTCIEKELLSRRGLARPRRNFMPITFLH